MQPRCEVLQIAFTGIVRGMFHISTFIAHLAIKVFTRNGEKYDAVMSCVLSAARVEYKALQIFSRPDKELDEGNQGECNFAISEVFLTVPRTKTTM